jgi:hypothetical protein
MGTHHSSSVLEHERRRPRDTSASWTPWPPVQETRIRSDDHPCAFSSSSSRAPLIPSCLSLPLLPLVGHEVWRKEKEMAGGEGRGWPPCRGVVFGGGFLLPLQRSKIFNYRNVRREGNRGDDRRPRFAVPNFLAVWVK